ncbi:MAG: hypothetical protein IJA34_08540 [Lachnospiraceae bacterium]|nr:hypothetical protein [Lachnospiraceae bacterium]
MDNKFDVTNLIRVKEIREYYRKNINLSIFEKEMLIVNSYNSLEVKKQLLKKFRSELNEKDKGNIDELISRYELLILIYKEPKQVFGDCKITYALTCMTSGISLDSNCSISEYFKTHILYKKYSDNIIDVIEIMNKFKSKYNHIYELKLNIIAYEENCSYEVFYLIGFIDGGYVPFKCFLDDKIENKRWKSVTQIFDDILLHIDLPFENGCKVKLQTPMMNEPFDGVLSRELDGNGCWYNFLYSSEYDCFSKKSFEEFIDVSYITFLGNYNFMVWDCLERA